jgi:hypothetical protein
MSSPLSALPAVPESALPASVRSGSAADKKAYQAALGFEQMLLGELVKNMTTTGPMAEGPHAQPLQDALTGALVAGGGIGVGASLYAALKEREAWMTHRGLQSASLDGERRPA